MRVPLALLLAIASVCPVFAQPPEVPQGIATMYDRLYTSLSANDRNGAAQIVAQEAQLFLVLENGGETRSLLALPDKYVLETIEPAFTQCLVAGDYARVSYDLHIVGVENATGEDVDLTMPRIDWLMLCGKTWSLIRSVPAEADQQGIVSQGAVTDGEFGVKLPVPEGWEGHVVSGNSARQVALLGPDPRCVITLAISEQPEAPEPDAVADSLSRVMPMLGGTAELVSGSEAALGGRPGYRTEHTLSMQSLTVRHDQIVHVAAEDVGATIYLLALTATDDEGFNEAKPAFDKLVADLAFTDRVPVALPAEYGTLSDGRYLNVESQVRLDLPEGWQGRILRNGPGPFMLVAAKPGSQNYVLLVTAEIGQWVDPKDIAKSQLQGQGPEAKDFKAIEESPVDIGAVKGYRMVVQGPRSDGESCTMWQTYLMRSTTLFVFGGFVTPAEGYDSLKGEWQTIEDSLKLGPEALEE